MTALKILVFSDSHRSLYGMYAAIDAYRPDQVIHLGDLMEDAQEVAHAYPMLPFCMVPGNCDGWSPEPAKKQIVLSGKQVLLSHGHLWGVKRGLEAAIADARASQADILLFGHTHQAPQPRCQPLHLRSDPDPGGPGRLLHSPPGLICPPISPAKGGFSL